MNLQHNYTTFSLPQYSSKRR